MEKLEDVIAKAKRDVEARGYDFERTLTFARALEKAIQIGLFDKKCKEINGQKRAVEAFAGGERIGKWSSIRKAADSTGVNHCSISSCARGVINSAGKYNGMKIKWRYAEE